MQFDKASADQFTYASQDANSNASDTAYFLVLSGGAFRGAFQFWVIVHLLATYFFRHISGVSVGSINGICAAMWKLHVLLDFWNEIENKNGFLKTRWAYIIGWFTGMVWLLNKLGAKILPGIYSMDPLVEKLTEHVSLDDIQIPFACGIVTAQGGDELYFNVEHTDMKDHEDAVVAIQASSCMVPFMKPPLYDVPETLSRQTEIAVDGGYWNIFPIPWAQIEKARNEGKKIVIHAVGCTPLERVKRVQRKKVTGLISLTLRIIEIMEAAIYDGDILQLRLAAGVGGELHLWIPSIEPGDSFDASGEMTQARLAESKKMVEKGPIVYSGIGTNEQLSEWRKAMMA